MFCPTSAPAICIVAAQLRTSLRLLTEYMASSQRLRPSAVATLNSHQERIDAKVTGSCSVRSETSAVGKIGEILVLFGEVRNGTSGAALPSSSAEFWRQALPLMQTRF